MGSKQTLSPLVRDVLGALEQGAEGPCFPVEKLGEWAQAVATHDDPDAIAVQLLACAKRFIAKGAHQAALQLIALATFGHPESQSNTDTQGPPVAKSFNDRGQPATAKALNPPPASGVPGRRR